MDPTKDREIVQIQREAGDLVQRAQNYQVVSDETYEEAGGIVSWIAQGKKRIEARRKFFTQPLNDQVKKINELFKELSMPFVKSDAIVRNKMLDYRQGQEKKRRDEEEKMKKEAEKIAKKEGISKEEVIASMEKKETVSTTDKTTVRKDWTFEIIDVNKIPRKFLMPDEVNIRKAVRNGVRKIAGINIYEKEIVSIK